MKNYQSAVGVKPDTNKKFIPAVYSRFIIHNWHYWSMFKEHDRL